MSLQLTKSTGYYVCPFMFIPVVYFIGTIYTENIPLKLLKCLVRIIVFVSTIYYAKYPNLNQIILNYSFFIKKIKLN